jgi:glycosyltransferase involved in cell wall biosynthesis
MKIIYLTWGETPRSSGVYNSQVIQLLKHIQNHVELFLIAGLPIIHSGFFREKIFYFRVLNSIKKQFNRNGTKKFFILPIFAVQTIIYPKIFIYKFIYFISINLLKNRILKIKPDIIHCRGYHSTNIAIKLKKRYNLKYKIIFDARGLAPGESVISTGTNLNSFTYSKLLGIEKENIFNSDLILAVSEPMYSYFKNNGALNVKTIYLSTRFNEKKLQIKPHVSNDVLKFVYAGALDSKTWHKPQILLDLYKHIQIYFPTSVLRIVTNSPHKLIKDLIPKELISHIEFFSCNSSEEVLDILNQCDVGILSYFLPTSNIEFSVAETVFAIKTVEYLSAGLPVIVNKYCGGASRFIVENNLGWNYDPINIKNFNIKIEDITRIKKNIDIEFLKNQFSYQENTIRYLSIYKNLLD